MSDDACERTRTLATRLAAALGADLIETHISWVLLTPQRALKIKKPVQLPFVDYGTLAARRHFCEEEVRLNARLAPTLYLGVSAITGTHQAPALDGSGPVLEYAVRMRRFAPGALLSERIQAGTVLAQDADELAALLAGFHAQAPQAAPGSGLGDPAQRRAAVLAAFEGACPAPADAAQAALGPWLAAQTTALMPLWSARQAQGQVRECHGDLHLANVVRLPEGVAAFDCIEFDPALRWIDVLDDTAFAVMDFAALGRPDLAWRFLNAWLDHTGGHAGLPALRCALAYRALVRAQVARLRGLADGARQYIAAAQGWSLARPLGLCITHGLPGSGKTCASQQLLERDGAIRLRSDVERKRLHGLGMLDNSRERGLDLYTTAATQRTYTHLFDLARQVLQAGFPVVLDAAFLRHDEREQAHALARALGVPFRILACEAPLAVLQERLQSRRGDASEANAAVLQRLEGAAQPLTQAERAFCTFVRPAPPG